MARFTVTDRQRFFVPKFMLEPRQIASREDLNRRKCLLPVQRRNGQK